MDSRWDVVPRFATGPGAEHAPLRDLFQAVVNECKQRTFGIRLMAQQLR
jgi:hypothetical protein